MKRKRKGEPVSLIPELEALRKAAHDELSKAEFTFMKAERALEAAKRAERMKGVAK